MHPSLAYMTLGVSKHMVAAILTGGGPNALSIRRTEKSGLISTGLPLNYSEKLAETVKEIRCFHF